MGYPTAPGLYWYQFRNTYEVVEVRPHSGELHMCDPKDGFAIALRQTTDGRWGECVKLPPEMAECIAASDYVPQLHRMLTVDEAVYTWLVSFL